MPDEKAKAQEQSEDIELEVPEKDQSLIQGGVGEPPG